MPLATNALTYNKGPKHHKQQSPRTESQEGISVGKAVLRFRFREHRKTLFWSRVLGSVVWALLAYC